MTLSWADLKIPFQKIGKKITEKKQGKFVSRRTIQDEESSQLSQRGE